jgi:hypothetical protein
MVLTSSLQDALLNSGATSEDNPGTQSAPAPAEANPSAHGSTSSEDSGPGLEGLAQPDVSSLPPNSTTPTGGTPQQSLSPQSNPEQTMPLSAAPPPGLKGLGGRLRGVLYGLAAGGIPGAITGAISPNTAETAYDRRQALQNAAVQTAQANAQRSQNDMQFESVRAADTHIAAMKAAQSADLLNEEARITIAQKNADYAAYLQSNFGIQPDVKISGNGQEVHDQAIAAHGTLAAENGGQIPPVQAIIMPHTPDKPTFDINVHAPSQQDLQRNPSGFRKVVDTQRAVQGLPPIDDLSWNSGGGHGYQGQRMMVLDAQRFLSPIQDFTEQNLPAVLAQRKQQLAAYQSHTDGNGQPDADPATVKALNGSVGFLQNALDDVNASKTQQASSQAGATATAEQKAKQPFIASNAEQEAKGKAQGEIEGQLAATGGITSGGTINPQTGADEGFLSSLPAAQQNTVRAIGEGRVQLSPRLMSSKDGKVLMA